MKTVLQNLHLKLLWLKWSWPFRWAHKPLCERFHQDVLKLGRLHVCRSCVCIYSGMLAAVVLVAVMGTTGLSLWPAAAGFAGVIGLSWPLWYRHWSRSLRDVLRFSAGFFCVLTFLLTTAIHIAAGIGLAGLIGSCWWLYFRVRGGVMSTACAGCPELECNGVCSGYELQATLSRGYEEAATAAVMRGMVELPVVRAQR